jgi:voltage-gated potassium channel
MTLITVTTVGYQELHRLDTAGRIFNSALILFGVIAMFFSVGLVTETIIELQLHDLYGEGRRRRFIRRMDNHYIVCGFGRVGRSASHELKRADVPFLVIDRNDARVERARQMGMVAVVADATSDESLRDAGVLRARGFISALATDAENVFVILSAKTLNPALTVVTRAAEEGAEEKLKRAGADIVFSPYTMAGQRLAQTLLRPNVIQSLDFAAGGLGPGVKIEELAATREDELHLGSVVRDERLDLIVLAIRPSQGEMIFNPAPEVRIAKGDHIIAIGREADLRRLELKIASA